MKKSLIIVLLSTLCIAMISAFGACSIQWEEQEFKGHNWSEWITVREATCTAEGRQERICYDCGIKQTEKLAALGHNYNIDYVWSDDNTSVTATASCSICNDSSVAITETVTTTTSTVVEPTCTTTGTAKITAEFTDLYFTAQYKTETISATGHDYQFNSFVWNEENYTAKAKFVCSKDSTHVEYHDATVTFTDVPASVCEGSFTRTYTATYGDKTEDKAVNNLQADHNYIFASFVWTWDADTEEFTAQAKYVCSKDSTHEKYETANVTSEVTTAATCTTAGTRTYTATYDGNIGTTTKEIPATGHAWGEPTWTWAEDYSTATAEYVCSKDSTHVEYHDANVTSEDNPAATCEADGTRTYTATDGDYTATQNVTVPMLGHAWGEPTWTWKEDYSTASAKFVCANDSDNNHNEDKPADIEHTVTIDSTTVDNVKNTYIATVEFNGSIFTGTNETKETANAYEAFAAAINAGVKVTLNAGVKVTLNEDIAVTKSLVVSKDADIDFNGHKIIAAASIESDEAVTYYSSLDAAINAAQDGDTVSVLSDLNLSAPVVISGKNLTLDLNGKTIQRGTTNQAGTANHARDNVVVKGGATVTIMDSSEEQTGKILNTHNGSSGGPAYALYIEESTVTLESGTIEYSSSGNSGANVAVGVGLASFLERTIDQSEGMFNPKYIYKNLITGETFTTKLNNSYQEVYVSEDGQITDQVFNQQLYEFNLCISEPETYGRFAGTFIINGGHLRSNETDAGVIYVTCATVIVNNSDAFGKNGMIIQMYAGTVEYPDDKFVKQEMEGMTIYIKG